MVVCAEHSERRHAEHQRIIFAAVRARGTELERGAAPFALVAIETDRLAATVTSRLIGQAWTPRALDGLLPVGLSHTREDAAGSCPRPTILLHELRCTWNAVH